MALARSEGSPQSFYSMSSRIRQERDAYYAILEQTQQGTMNITPWMDWSLGCMERVIEEAQQTLAAVLSKARFWEPVSGLQLNERQRKVLNLLLDDFEGNCLCFSAFVSEREDQSSFSKSAFYLLEHISYMHPKYAAPTLNKISANVTKCSFVSDEGAPWLSFRFDQFEALFLCPWRSSSCTAGNQSSKSIRERGNSRYGPPTI